MLGKPKYKLNDKVKFNIKGDKNYTLFGTRYIIDKYATFEHPEDLSEDIMVYNFAFQILSQVVYLLLLILD